MTIQREVYDLHSSVAVLEHSEDGAPLVTLLEYRDGGPGGFMLAGTSEIHALREVLTRALDLAAAEARQDSDLGPRDSLDPTHAQDNGDGD